MSLDPNIKINNLVTFNVEINEEDKNKKKQDVSSGAIKQGTSIKLGQIDKDIAVKSVKKNKIANYKLEPETKEMLMGNHLTITSAIFKALLPKGFLDVIQQGKSGNPELWGKDQDFDSKVIDRVILAFNEKRIASIVSVNGNEFKRIEYMSELEEILHKKSLDITKSEIICLAFQNNCSELDEEDQKNLEKLIIKYIDFIGVGQRNFLKILRKSSKTMSLLKPESSECKIIKNFLNEITEQMRLVIDDCIKEGEAKRIAHHENPIEENTIVITTTSSGGAHRSIANVIDQSLTSRQIPHVVLNESNLVQEDNLKKFVGISRNDVFNKISQQCSQMDYGKKLKQLDDYLNQFDPDNYMEELRKSVGNSRFIVSTSHHPENVRLVAEKSKRVCFQVCDFGELPDKLERLARTTSRFNLKGITFFTPSKHSKLDISSSKRKKLNPNEALPLAVPGKGQKDRNESPIEIKTSTTTNEKYEKSFTNYKKFTQIQRYPVHSAFLKEDENFIIQTKELLGIRQDAKLWILTMGSQGVGGVLKNYITAIIEGKLLDIKQQGNDEKLDVAVLCGTNESLVSELSVYCNQKIEELCKSEEDLSSVKKLKESLVFIPVKKLELPQVAALSKSCSAFLSKPGGGTTAEALMGGLPMLIHREKKHTWEFGNIATLIEHGATEVTSVENFYQLAKNVTPVTTPDLLGDEDAVDYAIHALWQLEMERPKKELKKS